MAAVPVKKEAIQAFQNGHRGPVVLPEDSGYDDLRSIWNGMIDRRPAIIARCLGVADVVACVNFAREEGLPLCIKGGGHNIAGLAVADDALMLDMSLMKGVWTDTSAKTARAQVGCVLGDVDRETQVHGLAAVLGFVSNTGITGLTLGGGFGYLTRRYGWTSDNVISMDVVAADGRVVKASEKENVDLFWALRGGGGNFGVVTGIDYKLYPVGPDVVAGAVAWRGEDCESVLEMYGAFIEQAPPELTCAAILRPAPPAPWLPEDVHGKPVIVLVTCHTGSVEQGERDVAAIKSFGSPVGDVLQRRPYTSQQSLLDVTQPSGRRYYWKSEYLPGASSDILAVVREKADHFTSPHSALILFPIDGAAQDLPMDHSAVGNRDARLVFNAAASWEEASEDEKHIEWTRDAWRDLRPFSTGGTYLNFLTEEEGDDRIKAALGGNYDRLVTAKTKWDPQNLFRMNKNIAPKG